MSVSIVQLKPGGGFVEQCRKKSGMILFERNLTGYRI